MDFCECCVTRFDGRKESRRPEKNFVAKKDSF
jgi:hypothetical protein